MSRATALLILTLAGAGTAPAQQLPLDTRIPLHSGAADPQGGDYGLWAGGPDYKASFHDGFAFYPRRGPDRPLVALRWQTTAVRRGGLDLLERAPEVRTTDWRHELRYGTVTEVYDVLRAGVEQRFVLAAAAGTGDVVVTGRVTGDLRAADAAEAWQTLEFADDHGPAVRYGAAVAFDSAGASTRVTTTYDAGQIRLTLAEEFVERAVFPITIDPLTTAVTIGVSRSDPVRATSIAIDDSTNNGKLLIAYVVSFASGDSDLVVYMLDRDFGNPTWIFFDYTTSWSTTRVDMGHVDGADRFTVAFQREYSATSRAIRVYFHEQANTVFGSGTLVQPTPPRFTRWQEPRVGGSRGTGARALIVFEEDSNASPSSSNNTRALGVIAYPASGTLSAGTFDLDLNPGSYEDSEMPAVVPCSVDRASWVAVWRQWTPLTSRYSIRMARVGYNTGVHQNDLVLNTVDPVSDLAVAGSWDTDAGDGRYVAAWVRDDQGHRGVETRRIDQAASGPASLGPTRAIVGGSTSLFGDVRLAHDWRTRSHWALTFGRTTTLFGTTATIARLGYTGGVTESATLAWGSERPTGLCVAYQGAEADQRFRSLYGLALPSGFGIGSREFVYPQDATATAYGSVCNPAASIQANRPFAGHEFLHVDVAPVAPLDLAYFLVSFGPANLPLSQLGFGAGCSLLVDANLAVSFPIIHQYGTGPVTLQLRLPDHPVFLGDLFIQAAVFPRAGTRYVTRGLAVQVR